MGLFDMLDGALATAIARRGATREAEKFARSVREGHTYWWIRTNNTQTSSWMPKFTLETLVFKKERLTGFMRSGHLGAGTAWLQNGPIYDERPTIEILTDQERWFVNGCMTEAEYAEKRAKLREKLARQYPDAARRPQISVSA